MGAGAFYFFFYKEELLFFPGAGKYTDAVERKVLSFAFHRVNNKTASFGRFTVLCIDMTESEEQNVEEKEMNYAETLKKIEDENYLIGMISVEDILRFGYSLGLNENSKVLDLCCGYGTLLKIWSEEFGVTGRGVDRYELFLNGGKQRLQDSENRRVELICDDVTLYRDEEKYDVVICSETIDSVESTIRLGERFLKPGGILVFHKLYAKTKPVPQELLDFDGDIHSLAELYRIFDGFGYCISHMATGNNASFERYIMFEARRNIERIKRNPEDESAKRWAKEWNRMYFEYRRHFEEQALFGLTKI